MDAILRGRGGLLEAAEKDTKRWNEGTPARDWADGRVQGIRDAIAHIEASLPIEHECRVCGHQWEEG